MDRSTTPLPARKACRSPSLSRGLFRSALPWWRTAGLSALLAFATGCSESASGQDDATPVPRVSLAEQRQALAKVIGLSPCEPSGKGKDYPIGPRAGQFASLEEVPWERLGAGDTVRLFPNSQPYRGKFLLQGQGTADAPVRVCGVPGPQGERPVLDGRDAEAPRGLSYGHPLHEARSIILVGKMGTQPWNHAPSYIQIDGLAIRGATPGNRFTDSKGDKVGYERFGACIWIERGHHVTIADNEITDCTQAVFSRSTMDGPFAVTRDIRLAGNDMHDNGVAGHETEHTTYIQSVGAVYEFNRYGPMRAGAAGNAIKDRSVGTVVRYNRIEDGARALDLVEAEDYENEATTVAAYRSTFVYGNQIVKDGRKGSTVHYGGDHAGSEASYRKGTLYFFHNSVRVTGNDYAVLFQLSTTDETAEVWNNVFTFDDAIKYPRLRAGQDNAPGIESGGIVRLRRNWIASRWSDAGPYHKVGGRVEGTAELITGRSAPLDLRTMQPLPRSAVIDAAVDGPAGAAKHPVLFQLDASGTPRPRVTQGKAPDLGAAER